MQACSKSRHCQDYWLREDSRTAEMGLPPDACIWRHGTAQHSTAQHSTAQHSTAQHSTAQHSMAMLSGHE